MADRLKKLREPLAFIAVAVFALQLLLTVGAFIAYIGSIGPVSAALTVVGQIGGGLLALVTAVAVAACAIWGEPTPHARPLTLISAILFAVAVVGGLIAGVIGLVGSNPFITLAQMAQLLLPAVAAVVLYAIHQGLPAPTPAPNWTPPSAPPPGAPQSGRPPQPGPAPRPGHPQQPSAQPPFPGTYGRQSQTAPPPSYGPASGYGPPAQQPHQPYPQRGNPQPPAAEQQPWPSQHWGPGSGPPAPPPRSPQYRPAEPRSQAGEFGAQNSQFGAGSARNHEPISGIDRSADTGDWQPAPQRPPERLQPSPRQPAVGPHSRPDAITPEDTGRSDRQDRRTGRRMWPETGPDRNKPSTPVGQSHHSDHVAGDDQIDDADHRPVPESDREDDHGTGSGAPRH